MDVGDRIKIMVTFAGSYPTLIHRGPQGCQRLKVVGAQNGLICLQFLELVVKHYITNIVIAYVIISISFKILKSSDGITTAKRSK